MIIDGRSVPAGSSLEADACIVGGGPAGIALGLRLAESPGRTVILLESGGLEFDRAAQSLARGETAGLPYYPLHETRVRILGGASQSWGGICTPLDPVALGHRSWVPGAWPFDVQALDRYLDEALALCGIAPATRAADDAEHGALEARWSLDRARIEPVPVHFSRPLRFGTAHRPRLAAPRNVRVLLNATATDLKVAAGGAAIDAVNVRCLDGPSFRVRARVVVLAGGGIENARLLLASNREQPAGIGNAHDTVGRWFMEHPRVTVRRPVRAGMTRLGALVDKTAGRGRFLRIGLAPEIQLREELLSWNANLQFGYAFQDGAAWPAIRRLALALRAPWNESPFFQDGGGGRLQLRSGDVATVLRRPIESALSAFGGVARPPALRRWLELHATTEPMPDPSNRVELGPDRDALGMPRARVTWRVGSAEERTHRRAVAVALQELEKLEPGIAAPDLDHDPEDLWPAAIVGTWHHMGATRMSGDPSRGVVDGECRVHGMENLYVAGSSVFPVAASNAPTVAIVQLSLRLADHLADSLDLPAPPILVAAAARRR